MIVGLIIAWIVIHLSVTYPAIGIILWLIALSRL